MKLVDFHTHTSFSDSRRSPQELIEALLKADVEYCSITDHDSMGVYQGDVLEAIARKLGLHFEEKERRFFRIGKLTIVSGIELSTKYELQNQHMIGLGLKPIGDHNGDHYFSNFSKNRKKRIEDMLLEIERKRKEGIGIYPTLNPKPINVNEFYDFIGQQTTPTRLHIGAYLYALWGFGGNPRKAMDIAVNQNLDSYDYAEDTISIENAIPLIHAQGGFAIMPHLYRQSFSDMKERGPVKLAEILGALKAIGLDGIEVHPTHRRNKMYEEIATELELLRTLGTDDHGEYEPFFYNNPAEPINLQRIQLEERHVRELVARLGL